MTDKELVVELANRIGMKRILSFEGNPYVPSTLCFGPYEGNENTIAFSEGNGYGGFYVKFTFDENGKITEYGVWE